MFKHHVPSHHFNPASLSRQLNLNSAPCFLQTTTSKVPLIDVVCTVSVPCLPEAPKQWQYPQSCDMLVPRLEDSAAYIPPMSDLQKKSLGQNKDFKQWASWEKAVLTAFNSDILFLPKAKYIILMALTFFITGILSTRREGESLGHPLVEENPARDHSGKLTQIHRPWWDALTSAE